jgi:hypothetical protein
MLSETLSIVAVADDTSSPESASFEESGAM